MQHILFSLITAFIGINFILAASLQDKSSANSFPVDNQLKPYGETYTTLPSPTSPFVFSSYANSKVKLPKTTITPESQSEALKIKLTEITVPATLTPTASVSPTATLPPTAIFTPTTTATPTSTPKISETITLTQTPSPSPTGQ